MRLSFMTFLYPQLTYDTVIAKALHFGYEGIEWRAEAEHRHGVELESSSAQIRKIREAVAGAGLETSCLATSSRFCSPDPAERDQQLERLNRYVDLAHAVGAPCIRFFADPIPNTGRGARAESYRVQAEYMALAAVHAAEAGVRLCLETHSVFRAFDAGEVLFQAGYPTALWINWHLEHCILHGEDVDEAYRHVKGRVTHAHYSMSPHVERQMELLWDDGFTGYFSLEVMPPDEATSDQTMADEAAAWKAVRERLAT
jgi:sugar phosphate isomerase/epimerase